MSARISGHTATIIGKYEGAGMGLAIATRIVELQGGAVDVEGAPNAGCTFHVTLPLAS